MYSGTDSNEAKFVDTSWKWLKFMMNSLIHHHVGPIVGYHIFWDSLGRFYLGQRIWTRTSIVIFLLKMKKSIYFSKKWRKSSWQEVINATSLTSFTNFLVSLLVVERKHLAFENAWMFCSANWVFPQSPDNIFHAIGITRPTCRDTRSP